MRKHDLLVLLLLSVPTMGCGAANPPETSPRTPTASGELIAIPQPPASSHLGPNFVIRDGGRPVITAVEQESPAGRAGLMVGDTIVAVDDIDTLEHRTNFRQLQPGRTYVLRIQRDQEVLAVNVVPDPPRP